MNIVSCARGSLLIPLALLCLCTTAVAEEAIEEIVVTGSFIRGTPEDAALPVDVLTRADMEDVGDPSINELVRSHSLQNGQPAVLRSCL